MRLLAATLFCAFLSTGALAQNWKQVHKTDELKWQKATGMDSFTIHKLWRAASRTPDAKDDESRIADLDVTSLADRRHVLLVTYAGEKNCLTITVFNQLTDTKFEKLWQVEQPPDGTGFCDTSFGSAEAEAETGTILVRVPRATGDNGVVYTLYAYEWNGLTYRFAGEREVQGR